MCSFLYGEYRLLIWASAVLARGGEAKANLGSLHVWGSTGLSESIQTKRFVRLLYPMPDRNGLHVIIDWWTAVEFRSALCTVAPNIFLEDAAATTEHHKHHPSPPLHTEPARITISIPPRVTFFPLPPRQTTKIRTRRP